MIIAFLAPFNIPKFVTKIEIRQKIESKQTVKRFFTFAQNESKIILGGHNSEYLYVERISLLLKRTFSKLYNFIFCVCIPVN